MVVDDDGTTMNDGRLRDLSAGQRLEYFARTVLFSTVSFGFFLAVGSAIRCEDRTQAHPGHAQVRNHAYLQHLRSALKRDQEQQQREQREQQQQQRP